MLELKKAEVLNPILEGVADERPELRAIVRYYNFLQSEGEVFLKVDLDLVEGGADRFKGGYIYGLPYCMGNTEEDCCH